MFFNKPLTTSKTKGTIDFISQVSDSTGVRIVGTNPPVEWIVYHVSESNQISANCTMRVGRTGRSSSFDTDLRVAYRLVQRTATANIDYENITGWIEFTSGATEQLFSFNILHDDIYEYPNEEMEVHLFDLQYRKSSLYSWSQEPANTLSTAKLGQRSRAIVIIGDDGDAGEISFLTSKVAVSEATNVPTTITVVRNGRASPSSQLRIRAKSVNNIDIRETQAIFCAATTGYFNIYWTNSSNATLTSVVPAKNISPSQLETQLLNALKLTLSITYVDSLTGMPTFDHPCTKEGTYINLTFVGDFQNHRVDQPPFVVESALGAMVLRRDDVTPIQNITCYADQGNFEIYWGDDPMQNITVNAQSTNVTELKKKLLTMTNIDDVVVRYLKGVENSSTACSVEGTSILLDFVHLRQRRPLPLLRSRHTNGVATLTKERVYPTFKIQCAATGGRANIQFIFDTRNVLLTVDAIGVDASTLQTMILGAGISNVHVQYLTDADNFCNSTGQQTLLSFEDLAYVDQPISVVATSSTSFDILTLSPVYQEQIIYCKADAGHFLISYKNVEIAIPAMTYTTTQLAAALETLPEIETVDIVYSTLSAPGPCTANGQNVTITFSSPANLVGVENLIVRHWSTSATESIALSRGKISETQKFSCRATSGKLYFYFGSTGPVEVDATAPSSTLKTLLEAGFTNLQDITITNGGATVCSALGEEVEITFVTTSFHGDQPYLRVSDVGGNGLNPLTLVPLTGSSCGSVLADFPASRVESQEITCTLSSLVASPTFSHFLKNGSTGYDYVETIKEKTLTLGREGMSGTSTSLPIIDSTREEVEVAVETMLGIGSDVQVSSLSIHMHPSFHGLRSSAYHTGWGPSIGPSRPIRCNGRMRSV